jgi:probable F420-dependent oxidoreductase
VDFGIAMFITGRDGLGPAEIARAVEERGFESLFVCEHGHIPIAHESVYPGGGQVPRYYAQAFDPFVSLSVAAMVTSRIRLGTGICLLAERDAIFTAKQVASVDQISGGRMVFGVAGGWNREEIADHGVDPRRRFAVLRDKVQAVKAIWTLPEPAYEGPHVRFGPMWSEPKPRQVPHPPILVGGAGRAALELVAEVADGWMPSIQREEGLAGRVKQLQEMTARAGRPPVHVTALIPQTVDAPDAELYVARAAEAGAQRTVLTIRPEPSQNVLAFMDTFAKIVSRWTGRVASTENCTG